MEANRGPRSVLRWVPSVAWMGVIFAFSSLGASELRPVSDLSTCGHLAEYAVLGALLFIAARRTWTTRSGSLFAVAVASAYGVTDELHQLFTPGRMSDAADWAADTAGAAIAVACILLAEWLFRRHKAFPDG